MSGHDLKKETNVRKYHQNKYNIPVQNKFELLDWLNDGELDGSNTVLNNCIDVNIIGDEKDNIIQVDGIILEKEEGNYIIIYNN